MLSCLAAESPEVPEHAYITYGDSWKCERGFKRADDECQSIKVPEHAFLSEYGNSWKCERGFKRADDECQSVKVSEKEAPAEIPEHAFVDYIDHWKCERGF